MAGDDPLTPPAAGPTPDEARRTVALKLAVELRRSRDVTSSYVILTARAFEAYLRDGTVER